MNTSRPLLSIAVPTYNRASSLRRSLSSLAAQIVGIQGYKTVLELIVSDNCSTDNTAEIVSAISTQVPLIYIRNENNLGMEGNFISCFDRARGVYVWTISDDDLLVDGALEGILKVLSRESVDLIFVPAKYLFGELDSFDSSSVAFTLTTVSADMFALRANGVLSFLSSVVVNKDRYRSVSNTPNLNRYKGTFLAHYEWIYTLLAHGSEFRIASASLVLARTGATGGYDLFEVFGKHYVRIGDEMLLHRPRMRRLLELAMLYIHIPNFIQRCRENSFGRFEYDPQSAADQIVETYGDSIFYRLVLRPMLFGSNTTAAIALKAGRLYGRYWSLTRRLLCLIAPSYSSQNAQR